MKKILFVCSQNKLRSPTGEKVFLKDLHVETRSAGLNTDATKYISEEDIAWADIIFVMEQVHKTKLRKKFKTALTNKKLICLSIPDEYDYMQPELIDLLLKKVPQFL